MNKGFIQIPILIAVLVGVALLGGTGYVAYEVGQNSSRQPTTGQVQVATSTDDSQLLKTQEVATPSTVKQGEQSTSVQVQVQPLTSVSAELLIAKCKAKKDASRAKLWPIFLETVKLAEQKTYKSRLDALMATIQPGTVPASSLVNTAKISGAEHQKNLATAEATMDGELAKEYFACLEGD